MKAKKIKIAYKEAKISKEEKEDRIHKAFEILFDEVLRLSRSKKPKS